MGLKQEIRKLTKVVNEPEAQVMARLPEKLKHQVDAMFEVQRAQGRRISWQILIEAACRDYLGIED